MKQFGTAAACVLAAVLGGCEASPNNSEQAANPCLGVQPAVGTMIVRKADCGGAQQQAGPGGGQGVPGQMQRR